MNDSAVEALLATLGLALLANPYYLGELLVVRMPDYLYYDGTLHFAAFAGLGLLLVGVAGGSYLSLVDRVGLPLAVGTITAGSVVVFLAYLRVVTATVGPYSVVAGYSHRRTFVVATVAALAALGAAAGSRRWRVALAAPPVLGLGLGLVLASGDLRRWVVEGHLFRWLVNDAVSVTTDAIVFGVPFLGGLVYVAAVLLGVHLGRSATESGGRATPG